MPMAVAVPVMLVATMAAGVVSAAGAMEQADATKNQMDYQSAVAMQNRGFDITQADRETKLGLEQVQQQGLRTRAEVGAIISEQGAGGLDVRSGSNALAQDSALALGRFNEAIVMNDAQRRSYDYLVRGFSDEASSQLYAFGARQAPIGGAFAAGGSVLGAAASTAKDYAQFGPRTLGT